MKIEYLDKVLLADSVHDFKKGFEFKNKDIVFYTCNSDSSVDGFLAKNKFFEILRKGGHRRPRGIFVLSAGQKQDVGQVDAIVMIDCKMFYDKELIDKLRQRRKSNNRLSGQ